MCPRGFYSDFGRCRSCGVEAADRTEFIALTAVAVLLLVALIMAITAGKSAAEQRWVKCSEVAASVQCDENGCMIVDLDDMAIAAAEKDSLNWIGKNVNRVLGKKGGLKNIFSR